MNIILEKVFDHWIPLSLCFIFNSSPHSLFNYFLIHSIVIPSFFFTFSIGLSVLVIHIVTTCSLVSIIFLFHRFYIFSCLFLFFCCFPILSLYTYSFTLLYFSLSHFLFQLLTYSCQLCNLPIFSSYFRTLSSAYIHSSLIKKSEFHLFNPSAHLIYLSNCTSSTSFIFLLLDLYSLPISWYFWLLHQKH